MKKLTLCLLFALSACSSGSENKSGASAPEATKEAAQETADGISLEGKCPVVNGSLVRQNSESSTTSISLVTKMQGEQFLYGSSAAAEDM